MRYLRLDPRLWWSRITRRRFGPLILLLALAVIAGLIIVLTLARSGTDTEVDSTPANSLDGMRGTRPIATRDEVFRAALDEKWISIDPAGKSLETFVYAAEAYDSAIVAALAAEAAGTDGGALADSVISVTNGTTPCTSFAECRDLLADGVDIDYQGRSGRLDLNPQGENVVTNYSVVEFGADNRIDETRTQYVELIGSLEADDPSPAVEIRPGDGTLTLGSLLPLTGQLSTYAPAQQAAIRLAVDDINSAGGVLGSPVTYIEGDSGDTSTSKFETEVDRLIADGVDVVIGPSSTAVSTRVIDRILNAGLVQISPANTNMILVGFDDEGRYFRMAPADDQQAYLLTELVLADGIGKVGIFAVDDLYGNSMAERLVAALEEAGIEVVLVDFYTPAAGDFTEDVEAMKAAQPEGIVLISFDEGARILRAMVPARIGPPDLFVYGVDANMGDALGEAFDRGN